MDLNQVLVFARVVRAESFSRAARELGLPKSTVSRRVSELEERLGVRLLQRTTRKLSLTGEGRTYYGYCARILSELEDAESALSQMQETPRGLLRVTAPLAFGFLAPVFSELLAQNPELEVELVCTDRVVDLVEEGFDLAIRAGPLADSSLMARKLHGLDRFLVASPTYLERRGRPKAPRDLERHDCIAFGGRRETSWPLSSRGESVKVRVPTRLALNDYDMVREAAVASAGIALLPELGCHRDLEEGRLERVLPRWSALATPVHAVYPSSRQLSSKVKALVELLREWTEGEPARRAAR